MGTLPIPRVSSLNHDSIPHGWKMALYDVDRSTEYKPESQIWR